MKKLKRNWSRMFHKEGYANVDPAPHDSKPADKVIGIAIQAPIPSDGPNLSGLWETFHQPVELKQGESSNEYSGYWGINMLHFHLTGHLLHEVKLGEVELLFGGYVSRDCNTIEWGNGQLWVRV